MAIQSHNSKTNSMVIQIMVTNPKLMNLKALFLINMLILIIQFLFIMMLAKVDQIILIIKAIKIKLHL